MYHSVNISSLSFFIEMPLQKGSAGIVDPTQHSTILKFMTLAAIFHPQR